jgi:hypothetical protein
MLSYNVHASACPKADYLCRVTAVITSLPGRWRALNSCTTEDRQHLTDIPTLSSVCYYPSLFTAALPRSPRGGAAPTEPRQVRWGRWALEQRQVATCGGSGVPYGL